MSSGSVEFAGATPVFEAGGIPRLSPRFSSQDMLRFVT